MIPNLEEGRTQITLRDQFATSVIGHILTESRSRTIPQAVNLAYVVADEMLKRREFKIEVKTCYKELIDSYESHREVKS